MIIETLIVGPLQVNCYIIMCQETHQAVVIDPGDEEKKIIDSLNRLGAELKYILLTHGHIDHISAVAGVQAALGGNIAIHEKDMFLVQSVELQAEMIGLHVPKKFNVDNFVRDGDVLKVGAFEVKVLETPGHSPGGVCYRIGENVFVGDTLFQGSIGRTDLFSGSQDQLFHSIKTKLFSLPDDTKVYPGHGPPTTIGRERRYNPFVNIL